jgi:septal ring-binding cell division protein DamX
MASNVKSLSILVDRLQEQAEIASSYALALHAYGNQSSAEQWIDKAEEMWEQWVYLKGLTRLIRQVQELRAMTRGEVRQ